MDSARRLQHGAALAAEVSALEADTVDREEMAAVSQLMLGLR